MGNFQNRIKVTSVDDKEFTHAVELNAEVDNGDSTTQIPRDMLAKLNIKPHRTRNFTLANGEEIKREVGLAFVKVLDEYAGGEVIFGEKEDAVILGNSTMQQMGILIDPENEKLIRKSSLLQL